VAYEAIFPSRPEPEHQFVANIRKSWALISACARRSQWKLLASARGRELFGGYNANTNGNLTPSLSARSSKPIRVGTPDKELPGITGLGQILNGSARAPNTPSLQSLP
jgi:hypothetical protein